MSELKTKIYSQSDIKEERFEFVLYVNNHIICQRFFPINHFDETIINNLKSLDLSEKMNYENFLPSNDFEKEMEDSYLLKELVDNIMGTNNGQWGELGIIPAFLKEKSINYLWDDYRGLYDTFGNKIVTDSKGNLIYKNTLEPYLLGKDMIKYGDIHQQNEEQLKNSHKKIDILTFEIKIDKKVLVSSKLQNYFYPLSAVNTVKIKEIIPSIITEIRSFLSKKNYVK